MRWFNRGSRSGNASKSRIRRSVDETSRETEKIFSPSMLDSIVVGIRRGCVRRKFLAISVVFRTVGIGISIEFELKTSFDEAYGAVHADAWICIREHEYERRWVNVDVSAASTAAYWR